MAQNTGVAEHAVRHLVAFLDGPDDPGIANPIHSTAVAATYGFRGPLVGGVTVYGWCVPPLLDVLDEGWLVRGWADVSFRQPVYPGDRLAIEVQRVDDGVVTFSVTTDAGATCVTGSAGPGDAVWLADIGAPALRRPSESPDPLPGLTLATAPVGEDLVPMRVATPQDAMATYATKVQRDDHPRWSDLLHPAWLAARMAPLLRHNFSYGPSIHARSQLQYLAPAGRNGDVVAAARFAEAFERKGHHYGVFDGLVTTGPGGAEVLRVRHTSIFRPAKREQ